MTRAQLCDCVDWPLSDSAAAMALFRETDGPQSSRGTVNKLK
jgi:hypothetical protein